MQKSLSVGVSASFLLAVVFFGVVTFVSERDFAWEQFRRYWYYLVVLWLGFGIQVGLYSKLRRERGADKSKRVVATSGVTSAVTMVSCCAHYMVNLLPLVILSRVVSVILKFQVQIFWAGIIANLVGIVFIGRKLCTCGLPLPFAGGYK